MTLSRKVFALTDYYLSLTESSLHKRHEHELGADGDGERAGVAGEAHVDIGHGVAIVRGQSGGRGAKGDGVAVVGHAGLG